jgi:hypothetical protein
MIRRSEVSMRATFLLASALCLAVPVLGVAAPAHAEGRVIVLDEIVLTCSVPRPNAFYILERSTGRAEVVDLRTTFTDEIVRDADGLDR